MTALPRKPKGSLFYCDDEAYEVEIGDDVEWCGDGRFGPATHRGEITAIQPKLRMVRITYLDETDWKSNGEPKRKAATVPLAAVMLMARVM